MTESRVVRGDPCTDMSAIGWGAAALVCGEDISVWPKTVLSSPTIFCVGFNVSAFSLACANGKRPRPLAELITRANFNNADHGARACWSEPPAGR